MGAVQAVFQQLEHRVQRGSWVGFVTEELRYLKDVACCGARSDSIGRHVEFCRDRLSVQRSMTSPLGTQMRPTRAE
jgi:hypothetical protein